MRSIYFSLLLLSLTSCAAQHQTKDNMLKEHTNALINESSPYLLQHAHNPVEWQAWGEEALTKAKEEDKPILVSIGYAACHWCHVMEHESFENAEIAKVMNEHFICIKVDREERPDVDQVYMDAVQAMGQQGGWPLNVFLTPEGKPFYGGTYFPPDSWTKLCENVADAFKNQRDKINESAEKITKGMQGQSMSFGEVKETDYKEETLHLAFAEMEKKFDKQHGGFGGAPKFPMPANFNFLLSYYYQSQNEESLNILNKSLTEMAYGGIYDQIGGGFARYSTDARWFAPHFEKMLYDNAQLVSVYAKAYQLARNELYKTIVEESIEFILRELTSKEGGFYSSLDADSEGEEGKFYCWSEEELKVLLKDDFETFAKYYNTKEHGNWEEKNILFLTEKSIKESEVPDIKIKEWKALLLKEREKRIRPGLDDKILASWNGLMLTGLCDAYKATGNKTFLDAAVKNAEFISNTMMNKDRLFHNYKEGKTATINGYLEDYAAVVQGFISLYQITFDEKWLKHASTLTEYTLSNFSDDQDGFFYFTDQNSEKLIIRKKELFDNVIPASNSIMACNLLLLGHYYDKSTWQERAKTMLNKMIPILTKEPRYASNWANLYFMNVNPIAEIAIVGTNVFDKNIALQKSFLPNAIFMGGKKESNYIPLLEGKPEEKEAMIYVCYNKTCKLPVSDVTKALEQIK